jgi:hypothetical protein
VATCKVGAGVEIAQLAAERAVELLVGSGLARFHAEITASGGSLNV